MLRRGIGEVLSMPSVRIARPTLFNVRRSTLYRVWIISLVFSYLAILKGSHLFTQVFNWEVGERREGVAALFSATPGGGKREQR